jgi:type I restriction enzyme S subunit
MEHRRLRFLATVAVSNVDKKTTDGHIPVKLCNYVDVYYHENIDGSLEFMSATATEDQVREFSLQRGDVLITKDSETPEDIGVPAHVGADIPGVVCGYHLAIVRPGPELNSKYLFWVIAATTSRQHFSAAAQGITRYGLRRESILDLPIPVRALEDQKLIAGFLDSETKQIDDLIEFDRRPSAEGAARGEIGSLVNLLRERRQSLITAAVTGQVEVPRGST